MCAGGPNPAPVIVLRALTSLPVRHPVVAGVVKAARRHIVVGANGYYYYGYYDYILMICIIITIIIYLFV